VKTKRVLQWERRMAKMTSWESLIREKKDWMRDTRKKGVKRVVLAVVISSSNQAFHSLLGTQDL
jgi:hypothetical protein